MNLEKKVEVREMRDVQRFKEVFLGKNKYMCRLQVM